MVLNGSDREEIAGCCYHNCEAPMNFVPQDGFGLARRMAAACVAWALVLLPVSPALAVVWGSSASDAACGHCKHGACCRRTHLPGSGPSVSAAPDCGNRCGQPLRSTTCVGHVFFVPQITLAGLRPSGESIRPRSSNFAAYSRYAYLYQRPPPPVSLDLA